MTVFEDPRAPGHSELRYRPDVDGLRAVAVLAVVFYHYGFSQVPGGFIGVDIFFVISGFLITGIIHREMADGHFTIRHFYERRIRRIFPALFAMLAVASVTAWFLLFPVDFEAYAKSLIATAIFSANFEFWREVGYFDTSAAFKPLLHLWSIAVEEQFYLLFPAILLLVGSGSRHRLLAVVGVLLMLSFGYSVWEVGHSTATAFYLLPSRMWELMLGALVAIAPLPAPARWASETLAALGAALIAWALWTYDRWMPFPGAAAVAPCLGSALVIYAGQQNNFVSRGLSLKPVVFVGLISYSLYLWHWPVLVFTQIALNRALHPWEIYACLTLSFVLAILSWRYVERPIRRHRRLGWPVLFGGAAAAMAVTAACGVAVASTQGVPERLQPEIRKILAEERNHEPRMDICFGLTAHDVRKGRLCRIGNVEAKEPSFFLWGDSHADALLPAVQKVAQQRGRAGLFAATDSCAPLLGVTRPDAHKCKPFNDAVAKLAIKSAIKDVILDARWSKNAYGTARGEGDWRIFPYDGEGQGTDLPSTEAVFYRGLERTVRLLTKAGKHVVIVASIPEAGFSVPRVMAHLRMAKNYDMPTRDLNDFLVHQKFIFATLARMQKLYGVKIIYPHQILCATGRCELALDDRPLYRNAHHLTVFGAMQLMPLMEHAL
ncbi:MAG TPA: acyltransferase family protein [Rhizomicrobium sp.]|jgi:peptidoglycan/LPS O-acetylase OafA/YrhL